MQIRELLNQYSAATLIVLLVLVGANAVFLAWWWRQPTYERGQFESMVYFYDLNTKELFTVPAGTVPPIATKSGPHGDMPAGVLAHVFCCGDYRPGDEFFIGKLEIPADAVPANQRPPGAEIDPEKETGGFLIKRPDDKKWLVAGAREERRIMNELRRRCPKEKPLQLLKPVPQAK